jgi:hypothetical protein
MSTWIVFFCSSTSLEGVASWISFPHCRPFLECGFDLFILPGLTDVKDNYPYCCLEDNRLDLGVLPLAGFGVVLCERRNEFECRRDPCYPGRGMKTIEHLAQYREKSTTNKRTLTE